MFSNSDKSLTEVIKNSQWQVASEQIIVFFSQIGTKSTTLTTLFTILQQGNRKQPPNIIKGTNATWNEIIHTYWSQKWTSIANWTTVSYRHGHKLNKLNTTKLRHRWWQPRNKDNNSGPTVAITDHHYWKTNNTDIQTDNAKIQIYTFIHPDSAFGRYCVL